MGKIVIQGTWPANDPRRAFVEGAAWWEFQSTGATMWPSDRSLAEEAAEERWGPARETVRINGEKLGKLIAEQKATKVLVVKKARGGKKIGPPGKGW